MVSAIFVLLGTVILAAALGSLAWFVYTTQQPLRGVHQIVMFLGGALGIMGIVALMYFAVSWVPIDKTYAALAFPGVAEDNRILIELYAQRWLNLAAFVVSIPIATIAIRFATSRRFGMTTDSLVANAPQ